jgi:predicted metalloendopeptidase
MIADIESQMQKDIQGQTGWLPKPSSARLRNCTRWSTKSAIRIIGAIIRAGASGGRPISRTWVGHHFEFERPVQKINKPVDRAEWVMTAPKVDAYEDPQTNTINFPAGILQPPFLEAEKDAAVNYGGSGIVIGHELIHGFDHQGRKFDAQGTSGACIAKQYMQAIPEAGVKQDGRLTQVEDTADKGGMHLAYLALADALKREARQMDEKESDGLTPRQRFFESYAFVWCDQVRPEFSGLRC